MNRWLQKWVARFGLESRPRLRRFLIGTIGFSVVLIGLVMIVLPGPAIYHCPTWLRYSGQRIRLGAPRLAARHHSGFAHPRQTGSAGASRNAMTCRRIVWPCGGTQSGRTGMNAYVPPASKPQ